MASRGWIVLGARAAVVASGLGAVALAPLACGARNGLDVSGSSAAGAGGQGGRPTTTTTTTATTTTITTATTSATTTTTVTTTTSASTSGAGGGCCEEDQNPYPPSTSPCSQGATWIAWKWVPACSFEVARIELHTDDGSAGLLADANDSPGAFLFQGTLGPADPDGWRGADLVPPIAVKAGTTYWIGEASKVCSVVSQGDQVPYYGGFESSAGLQWDGPYMDDSDLWTSRVLGSCAGQ